MDGKRELVCEICNEWSTNHRGALNLHQQACELRMYREKYGTTKTKKQEQPKEQGCDHSFRALNSLLEIERNALNHNYTEVCEKCQTLQ